MSREERALARYALGWDYLVVRAEIELAEYAAAWDREFSHQFLQTHP